MTTKIKMIAFLASDYDREEAYINTMSEKGWQLRKGGLFHHTYEKSSQQYRYKLDFNTKVNHNTEEYRRYLGFYEDQGWEHINATINGWHYFRKLYMPGTDKSDYEIYTDNTSLSEMVGRWNKIARIFQVFYFIYLLFGVFFYMKYDSSIAVAAAILGFLAVVLFQVCILSMKGKNISVGKNPSKRRISSYILLGGIGITYVVMLYMLFFGFYYQTVQYSTSINCDTPDFRGEFIIEKDGFYQLDINSSTNRGILMIQILKDGAVIHNCGGQDVKLRNKRLYLKEGEYHVAVTYYLEDYKEEFHASAEQLQELNLTGDLKEMSDVKVFVGIKR